MNSISKLETPALRFIITIAVIWIAVQMIRSEKEIELVEELVSGDSVRLFGAIGFIGLIAMCLGEVINSKLDDAVREGK